MKVILRKDMESLGHIGDVVSVKNGYARNYLIPRNIAYEATPGSLRVLEEEKKQAAHRLEKDRTQAEGIAAALAKTPVTIAMKVGEDDKLFGSVTAQMIAESLAEKGVTVDKRSIVLDDSLKALGEFDVPVKLAGGVTGQVKVTITRE